MTISEAKLVKEMAALMSPSDHPVSDLLASGCKHHLPVYLRMVDVLLLSLSFFLFSLCAFIRPVFL